MTEKTLRYDDLGIALTDVYEQMGYHDVEPDEATQRETKAIVGEVWEWLQPQFCFFVVRDLPAFDMPMLSLSPQQASGMSSINVV